MRRRAFISALGGAAAASLFRPLPAHAQQDNRVRRIGVFMNVPEGHPDGPHYIAA
jgi:putative ABC transport system substrate-binding protein